MKITLNGETHVTAEEMSLSALLESLGIVSGRVAVEINRKVIRKATYDTCVLHEGDEVEIVNFVGGG